MQHSVRGGGGGRQPVSRWERSKEPRVSVIVVRVQTQDIDVRRYIVSRVDKMCADLVRLYYFELQTTTTARTSMFIGGTSVIHIRLNEAFCNTQIGAHAAWREGNECLGVSQSLIHPCDSTSR